MGRVPEVVEIVEEVKADGQKPEDDKKTLDQKMIPEACELEGKDAEKEADDQPFSAKHKDLNEDTEMEDDSPMIV
jgi:hypothetical protein